MQQDAISGSDNSSKWVGPFLLEKIIGEGSFGRVYLGRHKTTGGFAAIKVAKKDKAGQFQQVLNSMISREASILSLLNHQNIVKIYRGGDISQSAALAMEFVSGVDLAKLLIQRNRKLEERQGSEIIKHILMGLDHMSEHHVVHRDLKPSNILIPLTQDYSQLKITDFGLSVALNGPDTRNVDSECGTPMYMSPERLELRKYTSKADVFSAGIILLEILTGKKGTGNKIENRDQLRSYFKKVSWEHHPAVETLPE